MEDVNKPNWWRKALYTDITGAQQIQTLINQLATEAKTNIVLSNIKQNQLDSCVCNIESWFNCDSGQRLINVYIKKIN